MIAVTATSDTATRHELADVLRQAGWTVHHAADHDDAIHLCRGSEADVLLLDDTSGDGAIALLDRLKRDPDLYRTAVVIISDGLAVDSVLSAMQRGAADVLRVPLDPGEVVSRAAAAARTKALVKELTQQNSRLEDLLYFDELTGLRNRRAILGDLEMLLAGASRQRQPFAVLMIDIDRFKAVNDEHGHRAGDEVLIAVADRIRERLRRADVAGRLGGDELLVVVPATDLDGARTLADSIRAAIGERPVPTSSGDVAVTVSVGIAGWGGEDSGVLLDRVDAALYAAKHDGRDRSAAA